MAPQSIKRTVQLYRSLMTQLKTQQTKLIQQRKQADLHAYVIVDNDSSTEKSSYHTEADSLLLASIEKQLGSLKSPYQQRCRYFRGLYFCVFIYRDYKDKAG